MENEKNKLQQCLTLIDEFIAEIQGMMIDKKTKEAVLSDLKQRLSPSGLIGRSSTLQEKIREVEILLITLYFKYLVIEMGRTPFEAYKVLTVIERAPFTALSNTLLKILKDNTEVSATAFLALRNPLDGRVCVYDENGNLLLSVPIRLAK
jgi:hypothetical protein